MPHRRTPIPLSPPEVEGLLNLRGDTVLAVDLAVLLGVEGGRTVSIGSNGEGPDGTNDRMNVVLHSTHGSLSMLVDEVGEVLRLPRESFEACPATISETQRRAALGVFKLDEGLLIQLGVDELHGIVTQSQLLVRA